MIGYAQSSYGDVGCDNVQITVIHTESFEFEHESYREIYLYNRYENTFNKIYPENDNHFCIQYAILQKIFRLLHIEEIKWHCARIITWRCSEFGNAELIKSEQIESVWLPTPTVVDGCGVACTNMTNVFYTGTPKPLEVSMLCDLLNLAVHRAAIPIANPFYHCFNSIFCSVDFVDVSRRLFNIELSDEKSAKRMKLPSKAKMIDSLLEDYIPEPAFNGNERSFAVDIKRECVSFSYRLFAKAISNKNFAHIIELKNFITAEINRFKTLAEVFVLGDNLYYASDIMYLTFYELMSAFGIYDIRLQLKKTVAGSKRRQTILNKIALPRLILPDGKVL